MNKVLTTILACMLLAIAGYSADFTAVDTIQNEGKTGLKNLITTIDANNALITAGTLAQTKITLGTNIVIYAGNFANRAALVVSTVTTSAPVGSVVVANTGKIYQRTGSSAATSSWSTVTSGNVE